MIEILIASNNLGKTKEISDLLALYQLHGVSYQKYHQRLVFPEEQLDYRENALQKATFIQQQLQTTLPVLGDDSGLSLAALPTMFNAQTHRDLAAGAPLSHAAYLCQLLADVPADQRQITLTSYLVLKIGTCTYTGTGTLTGKVALESRGTGGFDLDQIVIPAGLSQTLAELPLQQRQKYEQRRLAIENLLINVKR
ncbi:non-canonical purine NTP pyrophosphatase [Agrilactobacillus yilanensis]|uniref:Non-canonical purine NTP pyrophosphatase n=1 Tax=Agrilactobacillus yilanensis TaxID=2485997 RepID=A0ABW4J5N4_9LACO|nr:non-canonical purine NTP pyrophosphatase [Agrilactobacillus yilanensis]